MSGSSVWKLSPETAVTWLGSHSLLSRGAGSHPGCPGFRSSTVPVCHHLNGPALSLGSSACWPWGSGGGARWRDRLWNRGRHPAFQQGGCPSLPTSGPAASLQGHLGKLRNLTEPQFSNL